MTEYVDAADTYAEEDDLRYDAYRSVSAMAIVAIIFGLLGLLFLVSIYMVVLPAIAALLAVLSLRSIYARPNELSGKAIAFGAAVLALFTLIGGTTLHAYEYATEVPEGFERVSWSLLQADKRNPGPLPIPETALALDGKKIFIKGYVFPGDKEKNIQNFILVPDWGQCCFGGQPALTDMIEVTLRDPHRVTYSYSQRKLAGTLKVNTHMKPIDGVQGVYYQLDAEYVR